MVTGASARYMDGKTSRVQDVTLEFYRQGLLIRGADGETLARWPYASIKIAEDWSDGIGAILVPIKDTGEQVMLDQKSILDRIMRQLDYKHRASFIIPITIPSILGLTVAAVIAALVFIPLFGKASGFIAYLVPKSMEKELGEVARSQLDMQFDACVDPAAEKLIQRILERLVAAGDQTLEPEIYLYKTPVANAFTLPGEKMAVFSGFLKVTKNENEISAVLAHELGHMAYRDPLEGFIQERGLSAVGGLIAGSGSFGGVGQVATTLHTLKFSREKELRADQYAIKTLKKAGYKVTPLADFLVSVYASVPDGARDLESKFSFLSTHPATDERIRILGGTSPATYNFKPSLAPEEFKRLKQACLFAKKPE
ncbi:MAG: M48 family metallopeptidase [Pseudobdellovibrionaceae bacterium]